MQLPEPTYTAVHAGLLLLLLCALLVARLITPLERRLVTSVAVLLAGIFLLQGAQHGAATAVGLGGWAVGLVGFVRAGLRWTSAAATRAGPLAVVFLLPPAFFGAILLGGLAISLIGS